MKAISIVATALLAVGATASPSWMHDEQITLTEDNLAVPGENPLTYCAKSDDYLLSIDSIDLDPNPPLAGTALNITASGVLAQDVEKGAKIRLTVKYGMIQILTQEADLCDQAENVDLSCPIKKGDITLKKSVDLPKAIPPGKYTVLADVKTKDQETITCMQATVEFKRGGAFFGDL